jgi:hypothetical protein
MQGIANHKAAKADNDIAVFPLKNGRVFASVSC